jgi:peptidoglycan hydrolase CwlO-like protein
MADQLHFNIRDFRDILLAEIAKLEHGVRETIVNNGAVSAQRASAAANDDALTLKHEREVKKLRKEIADLNEQLETCQQKSVDKGLVSNLESEVEKLNRAIKKMVQEQIASENHRCFRKGLCRITKEMH